MYFIKPTDPNPITPVTAVMLGLLCLVWLGTGLIGHDPWKPDEAYSFGLIYTIVQTNQWLVPMLAGEPFMENPPLFYWTAAVFAKLFSSLLPLHDGARLASGFYTALTLFLIGLTGRKLYGENRGWATAIILIGCLGMLVRVHQMVADLALLAGLSLMLLGFAHSQERVLRAGIWLGVGTGIGFMAKGFIAPVLFLLIAMSLPLCFKNWRVQNYFLSLGIAFLCVIPWLTIWPLLLYQHSPTLFSDWAWQHNVGNFLIHLQEVPGKDSFYYLKSLPWLAWPALPLAIWVIWQSRTRLAQRDDLQLPLLSFCVMLIVLSILPHIKEIFALPMLLPLALLGSASLSSLKRGAANALDWFGLSTFAFLAILMWWGWAGLLLDNHAKVTFWLKEYQPEFEPTLQTIPVVIAFIATVLWLVIIWRIGRSMRRSVVNWAAGISLIWVLAMTLWLPWLESVKSYRSMVVSMKQAMPTQYRCIKRNYLGDGQRAMLHYFGNIITERDREHRCDLLLIQGDRHAQISDEKQWHKIWEGGRKGDKKERYQIYQRIDVPQAARLQ